MPGPEGKQFHLTEVEVAAQEPQREQIEPKDMPGAASISEAINAVEQRVV